MEPVIKKSKIYIIVRNDDVCALSNSAKERRILGIFEKYNVPQVISVIPKITEDPHDCRCNKFHALEENPEIVDLIREYHNKGLVEIAQHGYTHQTDTLHPSRQSNGDKPEFYKGIDRNWLAYSPEHPEGYSEFNGLSEDIARKHISEGRKYLESRFGVHLSTFVFPWDRLNNTNLQILSDRGFENVLCSRHSTYSGPLLLMDYCLRDYEIMKLPDLVEKLCEQNRPVIVQVTYHSWMFDDKDMDELDQMLEHVTEVERVTFIKANQIANLVPSLNRYSRWHARVQELAREVNPILGTKINLPRFYTLNAGFYWRYFLKAYTAKILMRLKPV